MASVSAPSRSHLTMAALGLAAAAVAVGAILSGGGSDSPAEVLGVQYTAGATTTTADTATEVVPASSASTTPAVQATAPATPSGTPLQPASSPTTTTAVAPTGSVAGRFSVDGHGIGGVVVTLIDSLGGRTTTTTDASGAYLLAEVIAGTYRLELADPGDNTPLCDTAGNCITTRPLRVESRSVEVEAGRRTTADVEL